MINLIKMVMVIRKDGKSYDEVTDPSSFSVAQQNATDVQRMSSGR